MRCRANHNTQTLIGKEGIKQLVREYIGVRGQSLDEELRSYKSFRTIEGILRGFRIVYTPSGNLHPHQIRVGRRVIAKVIGILRNRIRELRKCKSFGKIHETLSSLNVRRFGPLAVYDFSLRIGAIRGSMPEMVYLHAGTLRGARNLFGTSKLKKVLSINDFSREFKHLKPWEIEDFLCVYHELL